MLSRPTGDRTTYTWNAEQQLTQVELPNDEVVTYVWSAVNKLGEERRVAGVDHQEPPAVLNSFGQ